MPTISEHARNAYDDLVARYAAVGPELVHYWRAGMARVIAYSKTHVDNTPAYYAELMAAYDGLPERIQPLLETLDDLAGSHRRAA